jgi:hypothetical protein
MPVNCSGHGICNAEKMKCVCDKTEAFGYAGKGCEILQGPPTDAEAEKKSIRFRKEIKHDIA